MCCLTGSGGARSGPPAALLVRFGARVLQHTPLRSSARLAGRPSASNRLAHRSRRRRRAAPFLALVFENRERALGATSEATALPSVMSLTVPTRLAHHAVVCSRIAIPPPGPSFQLGFFLGRSNRLRRVPYSWAEPAPRLETLPQHRPVQNHSRLKGSTNFGIRGRRASRSRLRIPNPIATQDERRRAAESRPPSGIRPTRGSRRPDSRPSPDLVAFLTSPKLGADSGLKRR